MKIVVISDTQGAHEKLGVLHGDVLIHCGDIETIFTVNPNAVAEIDAWFGRQRFDRIFCIGGNHDHVLERIVTAGEAPFRNATWLHEHAETFRGVRFYGASWVPMLSQMPFYATDDALGTAWSRIPDEVDVLVTHTPPAGVLDVSSRGQALGCPHLTARLSALSPALHCFGHVHRSAGSEVIGGTTFVNATSVNSQFELVHAPFMFEFPDRE